MPATPDSAFTQLTALQSDTRLYDLRIEDIGAPLAVEGFVMREELSTLFEMDLLLLSPSAHIELSDLLHRQISLLTRLADGTHMARSGYISAATYLDFDGALSRYRLHVSPWLWYSTLATHNRVFQDKFLLDIIDAVFAEYSPRVAWRATPDVTPFLEGVPARSYCVQFNESDYDFVARLLAESGLGFYFEEIDPATPGATPGDAPQQQFVIFASSSEFSEDYSSVHTNGGRGIRFHRAGSQEDQDAVQMFITEQVFQPAITTLASYDYKSKRILTSSLPSPHIGGPSAPQLEAYDYTGAYTFANLDQATRAARLLREASEARLSSHSGVASVRTFRPGHAFDLTQSPLDAPGQTTTPHRFSLTGVTHAGINNLMKPIADSATALLEGAPLSRLQGVSDLIQSAQTRGYANQFHCIAAATPWRPVLADGTGLRLNPRPTALGPQSAIVVGPNGETERNGSDELYTDVLGRIKVRFHWQRGDTPQDRSSCWLRVAQRGAGAGMGAQFIPRIGQEVMVSFLNGDIDRPIVAGGVYNGQGEGGIRPSPAGKSSDPADLSVFTAATDQRSSAQGNLAAGSLGIGHSPAWHGAAPGTDGHRHSASLSGFKTREFGGGGYNQLVFDDTDQQLRVQLHSSHAASQLNLGHLIHQSDNYRGSFRGTGFELRTDAYGAVRAGSGLLLTTYHQASPNGLPEPAGEFSAGQALLKQAGLMGQSLSQAAHTHQSVSLAAHEGAQQAGQSQIDAKAAPLKALYTAASGMVSGSGLEQAREDATNKHIHTPPDKLPHSTDPILGMAAKGGLGMTAGGSIQFSNQETLSWMSGEDSNFAVGKQLHVHSGQAIGFTAGVSQPGAGDSGIQVIAAQGPIEMQAQSNTLALRAQGAMKLTSAQAHVDMAAAKSIKIGVAGGAYIKIEGGNIDFHCPGTIRIQAGQKSLMGPGSMNYVMPAMPRSAMPDVPMKFDVRLADGPGPSGVPIPHTAWRIVRAGDADAAMVSDEAIVQGESDDQGKVALPSADEEKLKKAYNETPSRLWLVYAGRVREFIVTLEQAHWTQRDKLYNALDAMGYSDQMFTVGESDVDEFHNKLARKELKSNSSSTILGKLKGKTS